MLPEVLEGPGELRILGQEPASTMLRAGWADDKAATGRLHPAQVADARQH
jgi:hypothetical protein